MTPNLSDVVAANVRAQARRRKMKKSDLADRLGYSPTSVSQRWQGDVAWKLSELPAVADALGVDLVAILGFELPAPPPPPPPPDFSGVERAVQTLGDAVRREGAEARALIERAHAEATTALDGTAGHLALVADAHDQATEAQRAVAEPVTAALRSQETAVAALQASAEALAAAMEAHEQASAALQASAEALRAVHTAHTEADTALEGSASALRPAGDAHVRAISSLAAIDGLRGEERQLPIDRAVDDLHAELRAALTVRDDVAGGEPPVASIELPAVERATRRLTLS